MSPKGKRLSQTLRSHSTSSWASARLRLPASVVHQALRACGQTLGATFQNRQWHGWNPALLDGTTYRLRPLGDIAAEFPPHSSGNNTQPYWCLARAIVAFDMACGVVLDSEIGSTELSEQALFLFNDNYSSMSVTIKNRCIAGLISCLILFLFVVNNSSMSAPSVERSHWHRQVPMT